MATFASVPGRGESMTRWVWWEGEAPIETNFPDSTPFSASTFEPIRHDVLSGGDWLTNDGTRSAEEPEPYARYRVQVPSDGVWHLWVRKFWRHGPFRWRFDQGEWHECGRDAALHDETFIRLHLVANWVYLGRVELSAGERVFEIRLLAEPGESKVAAFDAFLLIDGPVMPRGRLKPDERSGAAMPGFFAWEPAVSSFEVPSPISLRHLNERVAGETGFVRRDGDRLVRGDGTPIRFWMVQGSSLLELDPAHMAWWARRLAAYGVNLVRIEARVSRDWKPETREIDFRRLDRIHRLVAALRAEGIYTYLGHVYWARESPSRLFVDPGLQEVYLGWARALLTTPNPYTGLPLAEDPAVAVYEIQNEDSSLFWTFSPDRLDEVAREAWERAFAQWLLARYGSAEAVQTAWGPDRYPDRISAYQRFGPDDWAGGRVRLYGVGYLTSAGWAIQQRNERRAADQLRFMVETQRRAYERLVERLRGELGVRCLIAASNWKTADARILDALEHYTYEPADVICRNEYFGPRYDPAPARFWAIDIGDQYHDRSALLDPEAAGPLMNQTWRGRPCLITECNWERPNAYRVEFPYLVAAYGSLAGIDGWNFFALSNDIWDSTMRVWAVNDTTVLGQFPAAALMYRRGDIREGEVILHEALSLDALGRFQGSAVRAAQSLDQLWSRELEGVLRVEGQAPSAIDPLAFFVGRVQRAVDADAPDVLTDLRPFIDRGAGIVRSVTGELTLDYRRGILTVNTPRAQGAVGFLGRAGAIELDAVTIESGNDYGAVFVVSWDGLPLTDSRRILVQAGTQDQVYGFRVDRLPDGRNRVAAVGGYPLNVRPVEASVTLRSAAIAAARALDGNGYETDQTVDLQRQGDRVRVRLPRETLYTWLTAP